MNTTLNHLPKVRAKVPTTLAAVLSGSTAARAARLIGLATEGIDRWFTPIIDLALRGYVGWQFLKSGWLKVTQWDSTLALFEYEYHVPLLPPPLAAAMGAGGELLLPLLLIPGIAGRFAAAGLFVVNAVAVASYPDLSELGLADHLLWGTILLVLAAHGPGRLSIDHWLKNRLKEAG